MTDKQHLNVHLRALAFGGDAVGKTPEGLTVFVPYGAPGDEVAVEVTERRKNFLRGRLVRVVKPSAQRILPPCTYFGHCGGCQLQHLDYAAQLQQKKRFVEDALRRIGKVENVKVCDVVGMANPWAYRSKATFVFGSLPPLSSAGGEGSGGGFFAAGSHEVVDIAECLIQHPVNNQILAAVKECVAGGLLSVFNPRTGRGVLRWVEARVNGAGTQAVVTLVTTAQRWKTERACAARLRERVPQLSGVLRRVAQRHDAPTEDVQRTSQVISGQPYLHEELAGLRWRVHADSFFQVNAQQSEVLAATVMAYAHLHGHETVVDAFCGVGVFALLAARAGCKVYGIDSSPLSIADAEFNAAALPAASAHFICDHVERALPRLRSQGVHPDVLLLDPPRSGAKEAMPEIIALRPHRIVYVSCDPTTLARDVSALRAHGYEVKEVQPIDLFPQTYHVECVALVER
ncbi:MAG: 23S rRNA (uracil(1939)-C(5))-methyltransferase RlmD [Abditibacteriales bacterium]|nr:23S rRNA (uracil(1939)-C(5))-methyltransferase RlmD [Abditibacteriales bacterium]MDW8366878.1 23S rRNA (uracil(1939)-C(5))-methyltransferase RlmD [Abditibacteriales bacterium]